MVTDTPHFLKNALVPEHGGQVFLERIPGHSFFRYYTGDVFVRRHVKGRVQDFDPVRGDLLSPDVGDFMRRTLFDGNVRSRGRCSDPRWKGGAAT